MESYPLKLAAVSKQILWGGTKLKEQYGKSAAFEKIAESWELTVRLDAVNTIANGSANGLSLADYLKKAKNAIGTAFPGDHFPLLIKFIDAESDLSIQVHPNDVYALEKEGELGKTEMWYVMEADPGAKIVYGLKEGVTKEEFGRAVDENRVQEVLQEILVKPGDVYYIPAGQIHALGAGVTIAEIQQNSAITYRVYDYDRRQKDGTLRELHQEKAKEVVSPFSKGEIYNLQFVTPPTETTLASGNYFKVDRYILNYSPLPLSVSEESFLSLLCLDGQGYILHNGKEYSLRKGDSYFLPAGLGECLVNGMLQILVSSLPTQKKQSSDS